MPACLPSVPAGLYREKFCAGPITAFSTVAFDSLRLDAAPAETKAGMAEWGLEPVGTPGAAVTEEGQEPAAAAAAAEEEEEEEEEQQQQHKALLKRRAELYLAICTRDSSLIHRLLDMYIAAGETVKAVILELCDYKFWHRLTGTNADVLRLATAFPAAGIDFVLHMLSQLKTGTNRHPAGQLSDPLIEAVRGVYASRLPDVRLLVPFLAVHSREELV
eukprot:SAG22_NODE_5074_length_1092_cov_0.819738_2_plen_217_part_01